MSMAVGSGGGPKSDINVTPYIDILLVLLIIFMVIQPVDQYDLEARVPERSQDEELLKKKDIKIITDTIVISIDAKSNLMVNQDPILLSQLGARLFEIYSARANKNMFIRGASDLPFGTVVKVIDVAKGAGVGDVGLITEEEVQGPGD
ncbi:MAG: biopolymer transporter ExbD [Acidobacteria bacterium]|nr:biopolymer transporter ExbD [Acidobacteriota bacterium]